MSTRLALASVALLASCGAPAIDVPLENQTGAQLFVTQGCVRCHGATGSGSFLGLGPDLRDKGPHWNADDLTRYLADPAAYAADDPRLGEREMPAYDVLDDTLRRRIAEHVLTLMTGA